MALAAVRRRRERESRGHTRGPDSQRCPSSTSCRDFGVSPLGVTEDGHGTADCDPPPVGSHAPNVCTGTAASGPLPGLGGPSATTFSFRRGRQGVGAAEEGDAQGSGPRPQARARRSPLGFHFRFVPLEAGARRCRSLPGGGLSHLRPNSGAVVRRLLPLLCALGARRRGVGFPSTEVQPRAHGGFASPGGSALDSIGTRLGAAAPPEIRPFGAWLGDPPAPGPTRSSKEMRGRALQGRIRAPTRTPRRRRGGQSSGLRGDAGSAGWGRGRLSPWNPRSAQRNRPWAGREGRGWPEPRLGEAHATERREESRARTGSAAPHTRGGLEASLAPFLALGNGDLEALRRGRATLGLSAPPGPP
ncbi:uncharacterized protein LOC118146446 [Callithrix jacchus]